MMLRRRRRYRRHKRGYTYFRGFVIGPVTPKELEGLKALVTLIIYLRKFRHRDEH